MKTIYYTYLAILCLYLNIRITSYAAIYTLQDSQGITHFSNHPDTDLQQVQLPKPIILTTTSKTFKTNLSKKQELTKITAKNFIGGFNNQVQQ